MYLEIFLADFAVFRIFLGISRDFAGPRPREISEALTLLRNTDFYYYPHLGWVVQSWVKVTQG